MSKQLAVYTSDTCPYCDMLKQFLDQQGIAYEERNISRNQAYIEDLLRMGFNGVPITVVDGDETIVGYDPNSILQAVGRNGS